MKRALLPKKSDDRAGEEDVADRYDFFILAAEPSADLHGSQLVEELLKLHPLLKIGGVSGPKMRKLSFTSFFSMESLCVMGFIDVFLALPQIIRQFFKIRKKILSLNPKAVVCIDYPGFNLRLEKSLRKKGYKGKIIHYISPTVWIWGKKRVDTLAKTVDLLLTFFPFEKKCFEETSLAVEYVGHPLVSNIDLPKFEKRKNILALFPGSRDKEIIRNFPLQLKVAKRLLTLDPSLQIGVSISHESKMDLLKTLSQEMKVDFYPPESNYELMKTAKIALATSGTVTLELALHETPSIVQFAVHPIDLFIVQKILKISLPFYCIVNIIASKEIFPELFGPQLTEEKLFFEAQKLLLDLPYQEKIRKGCQEVRFALGEKNAKVEAARSILYTSLAF
jgi:lipid-A-disaccharide synthase